MEDPDELPIAEYLPLLRPHGTFAIVGVVPRPLSIPVFAILGGTWYEPYFKPSLNVSEWQGSGE